MNVAEEFDRMSADYTAKMERLVPYYRTLTRLLAEGLPPEFRPQRILDLGCGNGNVTEELLRRFPQAEFLLVDASTEMLHLCRHRFAEHPGVKLRQAWIQELDFPAESFDLATAGMSFHHLQSPEKQALFQRLHRWLSPRGCFACADLLIDKDDEPFHSAHLRFWKEYAYEHGTDDDEWNWVIDHYHTFDFPDGLERQSRWLLDAGFREIRILFRKIGWTAFWARK